MSMKSKSADLSILNIENQDLMKQICLKDIELFKAIPKEEISSFYWTKDSKKNMCPYLMTSTKQFNKINFWIQKQILDYVSTPKGVIILSKFIQLSKCLLDNNNFQSAYAVKAALDSTSIHRLEQLWSKVSKSSQNIWEKLCSVFSVEDNYQNLRNATIESKLPVIPFLGVYLSDLTGLDAAFPKVGGMETDIRRSNMEKIYETIWYYQQSKYDFKVNLGIQDYIQSMEYMEEFENIMLDSYFNISKSLEPAYVSLKSDSGLVDMVIVPQIQLSNVMDNSPIVSRRNSFDRNSHDSIRLSLEKDRKVSPRIMPDSPLLTNNGKERSMTPDWYIVTTRNLLDDSEVLSQNENNSMSLQRSFHHSNSSSNLANGSMNLFGLSPTVNLYNQFSSFRKSEIETKSYVQYNDPDMLTTKQGMTLVLAGLVKQKVKSKQILFPAGYQKVLAKLFIDRLDCYINFYPSKGSKMKSVDDFKGEYLSTISLLDAELSYDDVIRDPKIYIILYNVTYVIRTNDSDSDHWPSLDKWWKDITASKDSITTLKAALCQPQDNLIDLADEVTRL